MQVQIIKKTAVFWPFFLKIIFKPRAAETTLFSDTANAMAATGRPAAETAAGHNSSAEPNRDYKIGDCSPAAAQRSAR